MCYHISLVIYREDASSYTVIVTPLRNSVMPDTMRPSDSNLVLSKSNAKTLCMRNAFDKATFQKHTQQLQKERNSDLGTPLMMVPSCSCIGPGKLVVPVDR